MDFKLTPEQEVLKQEFEEFFTAEEKNAPEGWVGGNEVYEYSEEGRAYHRSVAKKLAKKRWLSLPWPKKYGGSELSHVDQVIFNESWSYHRVPGVNFQASYILVPSLLEYGSEEIKAKWLPMIANAETEWCQGWSEPNAGSDLASLTTKAVADGDDYVINGQKIWTSTAHHATHIFLLARTDPKASKHAGMTCFLSEMNKPGITVRPLYNMDGTHTFNEIFFDNVRVPKKNIVGDVNQGWYVSMAAANFERSGSIVIASGTRDLDDLKQFCRETPRDGCSLTQNPIIRNKLADLAVGLEGGRQLAYYCAYMQGKNMMPAGELSASKWFSTELLLRLANTGVEIMGLYGTLKNGSKWATLHGRFQSICQFNLGINIGGGTTETQKNVIAWMALGLPRK